MREEAFYHDIKTKLEENSDPERAIKMKAYMRDQYAFYGVMAQKRKEIEAPFFKKENLPDLEDLESIVKACWDDEHREFQFIGMELVAKYNKLLDPSHFQLLEDMITTKSWWDTVDYIAATHVGSLVKRYPKEGREWIEKWRYSGNLWLVRTTLIFQLKYKDEVDEDLLFAIIKENNTDKEFFIRKAIGWSLRQYGKYKPEKVRWFIENHELSGLSRREAMKNLK